MFRLRMREMWAPVVASLLLVSGLRSEAQGPAPRLSSAIENGNRSVLAGTRSPLALLGKDEGALAPETPIHGITMVLNRSAAQQAELDALLAAQQDPKSALYHQWLTPDEFGARFGVADADLAKVQAWLASQGFQVQPVGGSHDRIVFNGTAGQVATAFGTELHRYADGTKVRFAPSSNLSVPAELAPLVTSIRRLSDLAPHRATRLRPAYTSSVSGSHFLTPLDVATMYDMNATYKAGYTGSGQGIAVAGQSYVTSTPVTQFGAGAGLTPTSPLMVIVPNTGVAGINPQGDGDEGESQLDLEYSSGMAPGASVYFVYTGDDTNANVLDSLAYSISENIAPIITVSYALCETEVNQAEANAMTQELAQAAAQGQTVVFASGDSGSTSCFGYSDLAATQQTALAVNFPPSEPGVTAVGGTQMAAGTFASTNTTYWQSATGTDVIGSLLSYVPETVWNEDAADPLASGGGGASVLFSRPTWQSGVTGIPAGSTRLVPDVSLQASISSPGYIYCTSDPSDLANEGQTASCTNGLRSPSGTFQVAGGTSFAAPIFAGMLAVLNQAKHATGQGNLNPTLYGLAANSTTYASVFHDITTGTNACTAGATYCSTSGASQYAAAVGYDEASGLGSLDFGNLVAAWPGGVASTLIGTTITFNAASTGSVQIFVNSSGGSTSTPTGSVAIAVDGTVTNAALALSGGLAVYAYPFVNSATAAHVITVTYSGDSTHAASKNVVVFSPPSPFSGGAFTLTAQAISVPYNGVATGTFVITPSAGYTGTVAFSLSYPSGSPTLCYAVNPNSSASNVALPAGTATTATLEIGEGTACGTSATGLVVLPHGVANAALRAPAPVKPASRWPEGVALAGLLGVGLAVRRRRHVPALLGVLMLAGAGLAVGLGLSGCGGGSGTSTGTTTLKTQTYTVTLNGTDSISTSIAATTTFTLTVHP